ncbi:hypothetical protein GGX14DRAFT_406305 [Mycena pura]|uniref:Uncharacterized protein n=1 Tax=Mycena pura TaxID=153505 RepID=A0AAD6UQF7_9AGAR|nr:hypothetical protein GGX14DRAFT_406305 [Mycena pura]
MIVAEPWNMFLGLECGRVVQVAVIEPLAARAAASWQFGQYTCKVSAQFMFITDACYVLEDMYCRYNWIIAHFGVRLKNCATVSLLWGGIEPSAGRKSVYEGSVMALGLELRKDIYMDVLMHLHEELLISASAAVSSYQMGSFGIGVKVKFMQRTCGATEKNVQPFDDALGGNRTPSGSKICFALVQNYGHDPGYHYPTKAVLVYSGC